jgi:hypothetical protein
MAVRRQPCPADGAFGQPPLCEPPRRAGRLRFDRDDMGNAVAMLTILLIVLIVLLLTGGGGYYARGRRRL